MSDVFIEKAFWFLVATVSALVAVIYRLFNSTIKKDSAIMKGDLKSEIKDELSIYFNIKFGNDVTYIKDKFNELKKDFDSLKTHDNNNNNFQVSLMRDILSKLGDK